MASQNPRDFFDHVADGLFVCDPETCVVQDVNQSALAMIEYEREEVLGERIDTVSEPIGSGESWSGAIAQAHDGGAYRFELQLLPSSGGTRPAEAHLTVTAIDGADSAIVSIRLTGRRDGGSELRVTDQMRQILDVLPDPLFVKNEDGEFLLVNEAFAGSYGMTPDEIEGASEFDIEPDRAEQYLEKDRELIEEGRSELVYEDEFYTEDGSKRYHQTIKIPVELQNVDSQAIIGYVRDVTELKNYEAELEQSNEKLSEFASAVSHDLRNPLNVAESWLELAREEHDSEHLRKVARAHDRMDALIEDVLTLAREGTTAQEPEWIALDDVVDSCWSTVDTAEATLVSRTDRRIRADRDRLQRLLENVFRNAVEHGGTGVTVSIGDLDDGFYVADDGPGIPESEREQVFERGYSTSSDGTGFGLAIVAEVADAHGWTVAVTESEDGGARFEVAGVEVA